MASQRSRCPCCAFDLFLPPSERTVWDGVDGEIPADQSDGSPDASVDGGSITPLGVKDAMESLLQDATLWRPIRIVDTHGHAQLNRDRDVTYDVSMENGGQNNQDSFRVLSLACSVEPDDFLNTLHHAERSRSILPALGVHPWYLAGLETIDTNMSSSDVVTSPSDDWFDRLEELLLEHPQAVVGEIGLCKMAKWVRQHPGGKAEAMEIQRNVFEKQLRLAARLGRPVSVHVVNQHGIFVSVIRSILEEPSTSKENNDDYDGQWRSGLPPVIGMHSFTGTAHHVEELLMLEKQIRQKERKNFGGTAVVDDDTTGSKLFYFGFSHAVNYTMNSSEKSRRKGRDAVRAVPVDRIMVESDVHNMEDVLGGTIGAISYLAWARDTSISEMARLTAKNGEAFLCGGARNRSSVE